MAYRRLLGLGPEVVARRRNLTWALDLDEGVDLSIYLLGAYEPAMLRTYTPMIHKGFTVFDIGANVGAHTLHFARLVGQTGSVHAFEPTTFAFTKLLANLRLNPNCAAVVMANQTFLKGDGASGAPTSLYSSWPMKGSISDLHSIHLGRSMALDAAHHLTADQYCDWCSLKRLDLVKIDVDGNELEVLRGFRFNLARFRPAVLIELAPFLLDQVSETAFLEFVQFWNALGYSFFDAYSRRMLAPDPKTLRGLVPSGGSMNALLVPHAQ
jgi:FkbM family methyltransferase